jgi:hypothetical protein
MTSVLLNRADTDITDLSILQTGSEEATVNLRDALLDGSKDYHFCVSELTVPLQNIDMFGFITHATELFSIHRRTFDGQIPDISAVETTLAVLREFHTVKAQPVVNGGLIAAKLMTLSQSVLPVADRIYDRDVYLLALQNAVQGFNADRILPYAEYLGLGLFDAPFYVDRILAGLPDLTDAELIDMAREFLAVYDRDDFENEIEFDLENNAAWNQGALTHFANVTLGLGLGAYNRQQYIDGIMAYVTGLDDQGVERFANDGPPLMDLEFPDFDRDMYMDAMVALTEAVDAVSLYHLQDYLVLNLFVANVYENAVLAHHDISTDETLVALAEHNVLPTFVRAAYVQALSDFYYEQVPDQEIPQFDGAVIQEEMGHNEMAAAAQAILVQELARVGGAGGGVFVDPGAGVAVGVRQAAIRAGLVNIYAADPTTDYTNRSTYTILPQRKFYDVNQFMNSLGEFARLFNERLLLAGINGLHFGNIGGDAARIALNRFDNQADFQFLKFYMNCDGALVISADPFFWNHFMIRFTNTGSALLGLNTNLLRDRYLQSTGDVIGGPNLDPLLRIVVGGNTTRLESNGQVSLFQSAECRIKISVESHLPVQSSIEVRDEKETNNREIASAFFLNDVKVHATWNQEGRMSTYGIESNVFSGQFPLIHQHSRIKQWNRLLTSYSLSFFRFFLNVHYRYFDEASGAWQIQVKRPVIDPTQYWSMKLRFVSDA